MTKAFGALEIDDEEAWLALRQAWSLRVGTTYLNHGSFGPPPRAVREARQVWIDKLDEQPMDFFVRTLPGDLRTARTKLGQFVGTAGDNLTMVDNATYAMNIVARSFPLSPGDEVLLNDHEYGAVKRIWERTCRETGAKVCEARLPLPLRSPADVVDAIFAAVTERTKLIIVSHITSPTALTFPVAEVCRRAKERGIAVAIDGPHAIAQLPVDIDSLGCDYYAASCHKWLSAPFGSGFLYVHPQRQAQAQPAVMSWGRPDPGREPTWRDEFTWLGTRDYSPLLAIPAAIEFLESVGLTAFRQRTRHLARYARQRLAEVCDLPPLADDEDHWYTAMAHAPLPPGDCPGLQNRLWRQHGIEAPIIDFGGRRWIRVSCHLYTQKSDIDSLLRALQAEL